MVGVASAHRLADFRTRWVSFAKSLTAMAQIQFHRLVLLLFLGSGLGLVSSPAQFTANFQTNLISGGISNWAAIYFVGSNTFANALLIRNGGALADADAHVGYLSGSSNNH